jgi:Skp family chaperone for outer membrane proteins
MRNKILLSVLSLAIALSASMAMAQSDNMPRSTERVQENENIQKRCDIVTKQIDTHLARYKNNYNRHSRVYGNMKNRLVKLVERLELKGYDVTKLEADLVKLDEKILKLKTDYDAYIKELEETKEFVCGESEGQFKTALAEARAKLRLVHTDILDIRNYYQTVIKVDIQTLRKEAAKVKTPPPPPPPVAPPPVTPPPVTPPSSN